MVQRKCRDQRQVFEKYRVWQNLSSRLGNGRARRSFRDQSQVRK